MDNSSSPSPSNERPETTTSSTLSAAFWDETGKGIANSLVTVETAWYSGPSAKDYTEERHKLEKYTKCWKYGLAASCFLFLNFRITGSKRFIRWRQNFMHQQGWVLNKSPQQHPQQQHPHFQMGYLERQREKSVKEAMDSMRIITDLLVSLSVGTSGGAFLLHSQQDSMRHDFEMSPLVTGRSVIADEMCPGMIFIADKYSANNNNSSSSETMSSLSSSTSSPSEKDDYDYYDRNLETFQKFVSNCRKRCQYEHDFRMKTGKLDKEPVVIPKNALSSL